MTDTKALAEKYSKIRTRMETTPPEVQELSRGCLALLEENKRLREENNLYKAAMDLHAHALMKQHEASLANHTQESDENKQDWWDNVDSYGPSA